MLLLILGGCFACTEPFVPEVKEISNVLVVDGFISDSDEPYTVRLSRTQPLNESEALPEKSANVSVVDQEGQRHTFNETSTGVYQSEPSVFRGVSGNKYFLEIVTAEGKTYHSDEVILKKSPQIDSVYWERERRLTDVEGVTLDGVRILVDAHDPEGKTRFYRYDWTETYEIKVRYPKALDLINGEFVVPDTFPHICYTNDINKRILTANSYQLKEDRVSKFEVNYVSTESFRLRTLYSILVKQYALDEEGYTYWNELAKTSESLGTLFDPQPYQVRGNVRNTADPNEPVLGYFDASTVSQQRIFIYADSLPDLEYPRDPCIAEIFSPGNELQLYLSWGYNIVSYPPTLQIAPAECSDCRLHGVMEAPLFWPN